GVWIGTRLHAHFVQGMSSTLKDVILNLWWIVALVPLGGLFGLLFACDLWLWAFERSRALSRASLTRGLEPFEMIFRKLAPSQDEARFESFAWWVTALVLAPLTLVAPFVAAGAAWYALGAKLYVAALLAPPTAVAFFVAMGLLGDLLRHRAPGLAIGGAVVGL